MCCKRLVGGAVLVHGCRVTDCARSRANNQLQSKGKELEETQSVLLAAEQQQRALDAAEQLRAGGWLLVQCA